MRVSKCGSIQDPASTTVDVDLAEFLTSSAAESKDTSPLWSPCLFADGSRKQAGASELTCLAYDFDDGVDAGLRDLLLRSTAKHIWHETATKGRWRLVILLDEPVPARAWAAFYERVTSALGIKKADPACKNVGRFYYLPLKGTRVEQYGDSLLTVADFKSASPQSEDLLQLRKALLRCSNVDMLSMIRLGLAGKPVAGEGERDNQVTRLGYYLGKFVVPQGTTAEAVCAILPMALPGPEPRTHWEHKFKLAFDRGTAERENYHEEKRKALGDDTWTGKLQKRTNIQGDTVIISNAYNANVILENTYRFRRNVVEDTTEFAHQEGEFRTFADHDATNLANWLQKEYHVGMTSAQVFEQAGALAQANPWDPISIYLNSLAWDGKPRIATFLTAYLGCAASEATSLYSRKWLISLVARALKPGCKVDTVLVLQGPQGLGKSTALRLLSEPWFSDTKVVVGDKDSLLQASRFWVHEFAELASLKRGDHETIKAFFTSVQDSYRPPYGRVPVVKPRRCLFVATTNESEFLEDETGDRRYWVVTVTQQIDFAAIARERDQLLAEAVEQFRAGELWWLESAEEKETQRKANEPYKVFTLAAKADAIKMWWGRMPINKRPAFVTPAQIVLDVWAVPAERASRTLERDAAQCLRHLGFRKVKVGIMCVYVKPPDEHMITQIEAEA